jgi:hypothetical protein
MVFRSQSQVRPHQLFQLSLSLFTPSTSDFDDDEYSSTPIPFGRSAGHAFGGGAGGNGSGQENQSPTVMTPVAGPYDRSDRNYIHARTDSITSDDSAHSTRFAYGSKPFAHSSQSSIATSSTSPFTKKPSFASIRNAFKSSAKSNDPPPVPQIDHQSYPALKNPFNRSNSSLAHAPIMPYRRPSTPTLSGSPQPRAATPGNETRSGRATLTKSKTHAYGRSQHSYSGSIFHTSENGSDLGHGFSHSPATPPPVPRVPNGFGHIPQNETPPTPEYEDKVVIDLRTPSDYALHAVFMRFATAAEVKIETFLRQSLVRPCLGILILQDSSYCIGSRFNTPGCHGPGNRSKV